MLRARCGLPVKAAAAAKGHTLKHSRAKKVKHHKTTKHHPVHHAKAATKHAHHVTAKAKHPAHAKAKGLALATGDVACCTAEALAASLSVQGLYIPDSAILELFQSAGGHEDRGLPVPVMLEAAAEWGLGGRRLSGFREEVPDDLSLPFGQLLRDVEAPDLREVDYGFGEGLLAGNVRPLHALILGLELPGQHAVLATPEGWWSWGQLWCPCEFPDAVIDGAWAISWMVAK